MSGPFFAGRNGHPGLLSPNPQARPDGKGELVDSYAAYIPGSFNENYGAFRPSGPRIRFDCGFDFYSPQTFLDRTGRRIMTGWMSQWMANRRPPVPPGNSATSTVWPFPAFSPGNMERSISDLFRRSIPCGGTPGPMARRRTIFKMCLFPLSRFWWLPAFSWACGTSGPRGISGPLRPDFGHHSRKFHSLRPGSDGYGLCLPPRPGVLVHLPHLQREPGHRYRYWPHAGESRSAQRLCGRAADSFASVLLRLYPCGRLSGLCPSGLHHRHRGKPNRKIPEKEGS